MSTDVKIEYLLGSTTSLMFVFSWFLPNEKTEWIALVGILITYVIAETIMVNHSDIIPKFVIKGVTDALGKPSMREILMGMIPPVIVSLFLLLTTLIPLSIAIVVNNRNKDNEEEYKELMKDYKTVLMAIIISILSFILVLFIANINLHSSRATIAKSAVIAFLIFLFYTGSSIWMMYRANEIMRQYKKSE